MTQAKKADDLLPADVVELLTKQAALIDGLQAKIQELEKRAGPAAKMQPQDDKPLVRADRPGPGGAWIVQAPREEYNGVTAGISFVNGVGIVDIEMDGADRIVHQLEHDFSYKVAAVEADELMQYYKMRSAAGARPKPGRPLGEALTMTGRV